MTIRIAINGFGRIGRAVFRIVSQRSDIEVVAVNDLFENDTLAYLLKHDTVHSTFEGTIRTDDRFMYVDDHAIEMLEERDPAQLPWGKLDIDVVVESTGVFRSRDALLKHIQAGAKRVVLTVPPADELDAMVVMGVNDDILTPSMRMVSNASCTTNCLAPMAKMLDSAFQLESGIISTVHAYTNDQRLADVPHKDFRRSRAAAENIIPTTTGAARAVGKILPHLSGKIDGMAIRVPVPDGSVVDLVANLGTDVDVERLHDVVRQSAESDLKDIVEYCDRAVVSSDIVGNHHSCIFDPALTRQLGPRTMRMLAWYDNEWGYSNRVVDLVVRLAGFGPPTS
ncbi:MAG: type I glyceraldehyde-3-phosphate dehydrogenase [Myxococcales bacterium]|nr:type I glyceraldehyde-3-phosphate dehydrogenase [Myxococcales bacterium]|tara:strand:+ start:4319 stop:5335 length:1017 start_codon:yes stop_codon:yes gene_type:complete